MGNVDMNEHQGAASGLNANLEKQRPALTRLFDYYLATAAAAMDALFPADPHRRPAIPAPTLTMPAPPVAEPAVARTWLDAERATLVAVSGQTATQGWPRHAIRLATILYRYLDAGRHFTAAAAIHAYARLAAQQLRDRPAEARALMNLAAVAWRQGHYAEAVDYDEQALPLLRETGDQVGESRALVHLGRVCQRLHRYQLASAYNQRAVDLAREIGDKKREARALTNIGTTYKEIGDQQEYYDQAVYHLEQALVLSRAIGDHRGEARTLNRVGEALLATGEVSEARDKHTAALRLARQLGDQNEQARAHDGLARTHDTAGDLSQTRTHLRHALALYKELADPDPDPGVVVDIRDRLTALGQTGTGRG